MKHHYGHVTNSKKLEKSANLHDFVGSREAFIDSTLKKKKAPTPLDSHAHSSHNHTPAISPRKIKFGRSITTKK